MRNLCGVVAALVIAGCSASYDSERLFWRAQQLNAQIVKSPGSATPDQFAGAIVAFDRVLQQTPGTVWAARAQLAKGSLSALQSQYPQAREAYALVVQNYNQYKNLTLKARLATAKTYEAEHQWEEAAKAYGELASHHPWTVAGMEALLYVGRMYEQRKEPDQAARTYERAVRRYTQLIPDAPTPELAVQMKGYLAVAYQQLGKWDHAVTTLEELTGAPHGVNRPLVLLMLGTIYQNKLGNPQKAESIYTKLVTEFPEHPFGKAAKTKLEELSLPLPLAPPLAPASSP